MTIKLLIVLLSSLELNYFSQTELFFTEALKLYKVGKYQESINIAENIYANYPNLSENIYLLANNHYKTGNYSKAIYYFELLSNTKEYHKYPLTYFFLAEINMILNNQEKALQQIRFFQNNYKKTHPNEYEISKAYIKSINYSLNNNLYNNIDISTNENCFATYSSRYISDNLYIYHCSTDEKEYLTPYSNIDAPENIKLFLEYSKSFNYDLTDLSFTSDFEKVYFSKCTYGNPPFCKINYSSFDGQKWTKPIELEKDSLYSSQGILINDSILIFASNRYGSIGGMDLWKWQLSKDSIPHNLGNIINTLGDEITPFYCKTTNHLYFSSNYHTGFGGFDIFKTEYNNIENIKNIGAKYNTSYHDIYFSKNKINTHSILISNRQYSIINEDSLYLNRLYQFTESQRRDTIELVLHFAKAQPKYGNSNYTEELYKLKIEKGDSSNLYIISEKNIITLDSLLINNCEWHNNSLTIEIENSYSYEGTDEYNISLAKKRETSIMKYIEALLTNNCKELNIQYKSTILTHLQNTNIGTKYRYVKLKLY